MKRKTNAVQNLREIRFKLAEKWAAYEDGDISDKEAKNHIGFGTALINACKTDVIRQHFTNVVERIDFIDSETFEKRLPGSKIKGIAMEVFNQPERKA